MSINIDGDNNLIINTSNTSNTSIICSSTYTLVSNLYTPSGFLAPTPLLTPLSDTIIGMTNTVNSTNGNISSGSIKDLGATYTFSAPGIYLINLYIAITPSSSTTIITNCGIGISTSSTSFERGTGQINCYSISSVISTSTKLSATFQKVVTVLTANLQHFFLINMIFSLGGTFAYVNNACYWTYTKIG